MKNLTSHIITSAVLVGMFGAFAAISNIKPSANTTRAMPSNIHTVGEPNTVSTDSAQVEEMKACAEQAQLDRARWFFDETGIATTPDSGAAQRYANLMAAQGVTTSTPIPSPICE